MEMHVYHETATLWAVIICMVSVSSVAVGQEVHFFDTSVTTQEGEQFTVRVEVLGTITQTIRVIVEVDNDINDDFIGATQVATFTPTSNIASVTFTVRDDDIPEDKEHFQLQLYLIDYSIKLGNPSSIPVTIDTNDDAYGVFSFLQVSPVFVTEEVFTSVVSLRVSRSVSFFGTIGVIFIVNSTAQGGGEPGVDISPVTGSLTFQPNQQEAILQLQILPDSVPENDESFLIMLTYATFSAKINISEIVLTIAANDAPIRFFQETYLFDEGPQTRSVTVNVSRGLDSFGNIVGPVNKTATIVYKFESGMALSGMDFSSADGELSFEPGVTVKTIAFIINDDTFPEIAESFKIRLQYQRGDAVLVYPNVMDIIINANDNPSGIITFQPVTEGSSAIPVKRVNEDIYSIATFKVLRNQGTFGEVSIDWVIQRADGRTEPVEQDVGPVSGRLVFASGENEKSIELTIVQEILPEPAEQFNVILQASSVTGEAKVQGITTAKLTIEDSDDVYGTVEFGSDASQGIVITTQPRTLQLSITRSGGRLEHAHVNISMIYIDHGTLALSENIFVTSEVTAKLPAGQDVTVVQIAILPAAFLTIGGQFNGTLNAVQLDTEPLYGAYNSPKIGTKKQISVIVTEAQANGETGFNNTDSIVVREPDSGMLEIPLLIMREGMSGTASIHWSVSGIGASVQTVNQIDVAALSGTINIESGTSSKNLVIYVLADDVPELDETLVVRLESIEPLSTQRLRTRATEVYIKILENDNPGGVFQFSSTMQTRYSVQEGLDPIEVVIERTGGSLVTRNVQFVIEPNGTIEFFGVPSAFVFAPGVTTAKSTILAKSDGVPELAENFTLRLLPLGTSVLGERTSIGITVLESDYPYGRIQFLQDPSAVITGESVSGVPVNITLTVQRDRGTFGRVTVPWSLFPLTDIDLQPSSGLVVFEAGETIYKLLLQTVNDNISEPDETYAVQLGNPTGGAVPGIPVVTTITILENDQPIVFTETLAYAEEPSTRQFTVQRSGKLDAGASVLCRTLDGSASFLEGDYQEIFRQMLSFAPGEANRTFVVTVLEDSLPEGNETFILELSDASGDLLITNSSRATVVILANDDAYGVFSFLTPSNNRVEEGSTIFYNIVRNRGSFGVVEVSWEMQTMENTLLPEGSQFKNTSGTIIFQQQEGRQPLAITPLADQIPELQETFKVVLTGVRVLTGLTDRPLARLAESSLQMDVVILASDDPYGRFAFLSTSKDLNIAEDYYAYREESTRVNFTIERRQGTQGTVQVLWQIFSDPFSSSLPSLYDLLFMGQWSTTVLSVPDKQRPGTETYVLQFSGDPGSYVTVPAASEPTTLDLSNGFSISAWVQPFNLSQGYIVARSSSDGTIHYYSLRLTATSTSTTLDMTITSASSNTNSISPAVSAVVVQDGHWHHVLVAVSNASVLFYLDGTLVRSSAVADGIPRSGPGMLLVGARPPGIDLFKGYMQDIRIWTRTFQPSDVMAVYQNPPLTDVTPVSGILSYADGVRTGTFTVQSIQDIEEEDNEVFSVRLMSSKGGASLSIADSRTTLTVLKSDNANGLFGFREPCSPQRSENETGFITCNVARQRGNFRSVTVMWFIWQTTLGGLVSAENDFIVNNGSVVFAPGERLKTFQVQIREETMPELDENFDITLVSAVSDDGLMGSTNTSGASIDPTKQTSRVTIVNNDFPYGLMQFSSVVGMPPTIGTEGMILPATRIPNVYVGEEGGVVSLLVERAQGVVGAISVEWRTIDRTAISNGKIPPDYVGAVGRLDFRDGQNYAFVNITVKDNSLPEPEKTFQVELINPTGGAALGMAASILVTINASDNAFGVYQFADDSLTISAQETGDVGYSSAFLKIDRLGGTFGADIVTWSATEDEDDEMDLMEKTGNVSFSDGQTTANLEIRVRGDTQPELDEIVSIHLLQVLKGELGDTLRQSATVTIQANDDPYGSFVIISSQRPVRVDEAFKAINLTVRRLYGKYGSVSVGYQSVAPGETYNYLPGPVNRADYQDFNNVSGNVSFLPNQEYAFFSVTILDDTEPEQDESIFVRLVSTRLVQAAQLRPVPNSPRLGLDSESYAQIIINSNDNASGVLELSPTTLTVNESVGVPQIRVVRSGGMYGEVSVQLRSIDGEAKNLQDFSLLSSQVVLASGETSKLLSLIIVDDLIPEMSESFTVELVNQVTGGAVLGVAYRAVITIEPSDDPNGVFEFASAGQSVEEPENGQPYTVNITVVRIGGSMDVVTIQWTATLNGNPLQTDISPSSGVLYFVSNEASRYIVVSILPDDLPEGKEDIHITMLSATNGGCISERNTYVLTIRPNDNPSGFIHFSSVAYEVQEDILSPQYLQLSRSGGTYGRLKVYYSTSVMDVVTEATADGTPVINYFSAAVVGQRGSGGTAFSVSSATNQLLACASNCLVNLVCQAFQFGHMSNEVLCTWFSNSVPVSDLIPSQNVTYYAKNFDKVKAIFATAANPGEDYVSIVESAIIIHDGNTTGQIPVTILDDNIPELAEKFVVKLLRVEVDDLAAITKDPPQLIAPTSATVTILTNDNAYGAFRIYSDSPSANLTQRTVKVLEQDKLAVDLTVERQGGSIGDVTVTWQVSSEGQTAVLNEDFVADGATLNFIQGENRRIVTVTILDDTVPENDEKFTIKLINPGGGATLSNDNYIDVIILANDNVGGILSFNTSSVLSNEGDRFNVGVRRTQSTQGTVVVTWIIQGLNNLLPQLGFLNYSGFLTFLPGESEKTISLTTLSDDTPELDEEYRLLMSNITTTGVSATGAAIISAQFGSLLITIAGSNDPHGVLQFASTSLAVMTSEDAGNVTLQVNRKFGAIGTVTVEYQVVQGALSTLSADLSLASPGLDFISRSSFVNMSDGITSISISVIIINDDLPEVEEVFLVRLVSVTLVGSALNTFPPRLSSNGTVAEIKIGANDGAQGVIVFATDSRNVSVDEISPNISLSVLRTEGTFGEVSVFFYTQSITEATDQGVDFVLVPGEVVFAPGENRKNIVIQIINDDLPEPEEQFQVILTTPRNGAMLGQFIRATVRILANDGSAGQVYFSQSIRVELQEPRENNQTGSKAELSVHRGPGIYGRITVPFTITMLSGQLTVDVSPASGNIFFEDRQTVAILEVSAVDDGEPETAEEFVLKLQPPSNGAVLGANSTASIIVAASNSPYGLFEIFPANSRASNLTVEENNHTIYLDIVRSKGLQGRVSVDITTTANTATFMSSNNSIVLAELQTISAISVNGWYPVIVGNKTFLIMLSPLSSNQSLLYMWQGQLTFVQTLATDGASSATSFSIGSNNYFVIANSGKEGARDIQSIVYQLNADGTIQIVQGLNTQGAADVKYFTQNNQQYIVFANSLNNTSHSDISSYVYMWDAAVQRFGSIPIQLISTLYSRAVEVFSIDGVVYMAVANYYDRSVGSYETDSVVYRKIGDGTFVQHQRLRTAGAVDIAYVTIRTVHYLLIANNRQNVISSPQTSRVYRWDSAVSLFIQHQDLPTTRVQATKILKMDDGTVMLAIANSVGTSQVFQWNVSSSSFTPVWSGDPCFLLEPFAIQQPAGTLYLLASVNANQTSSTFYQIARITADSDFVPRRVTLTFEVAQTMLHSSVVVLQDDKPEDSESFTVGLVSPLNGAEIGPQQAVTINILSNDNANGIIQFAADSVNVVAEEKDDADNTIQLNVVRQGGFFGRVVVQWTTTGDHNGLADITPLAGAVEFANGQSVATISLTIRSDSLAEFAEITYVRLTQIVEDGSSLPSQGAKLGEITQATVTVLANDSPYGRISWNSTSIMVSEPEGTDLIVTLTVVREQGLQGEIRVSYVTSMALNLPPDNQAIAGQDFVSTQGAITMAPNVMYGNIQIVIKQDSYPEAAETFFVNLTQVELVGNSMSSNAAPSIKVPGNVFQVTILENDNAQGVVQFDVNTNVEGRLDTYEEYGRNNTIDLLVRRIVGYFGSITVTWQAVPITANVLDFSPGSGTVFFQNGQHTANISITIIDDQIPEVMESFDVKLISVSGDAILGTATSVRIAILKNDSPTGIFRFSTRKVEISEPRTPGDNLGQAMLIIQREQGTQGTVNLQWHLNAGAQEDFSPPLEGTLTFSPGQIEQTLTLQARADNQLEGLKTFIVSLVSADNNADISSSEGDATIIILPDPGASGTVSIVPSSQVIFIGEPGEYSSAYNGTASILLSRAPGIFGEVVVTWSLTPRDMTAFMQVEGSVTFLNLQQTASIILQTIDDGEPESRMTYTLQLNSASGGAVLASMEAVKATIMYAASDYPHGFFEFTLPETVTVLEDIAAVQATVRRNKGLVGQVQVYYSTASGTAISGQDFFPTAGMLQFENGIDSQVVQVSLIPDSMPEGPETFFINITSVNLLSPISNNYTVLGGLQLDMPPAVGTIATKTVIIAKNDNAEGIIEFDGTALAFKVQEESGIAQVPVIRRVGNYGLVTVSFETREMTATSGVDYSNANGVLEFKDGQTRALINVTLRDDSIREFEEQFNITLSNPTGGVLLGEARVSVVTILKSDYPNGKFGFLGETRRSFPNPNSPLNHSLYIERSEGVLGQQEVQWRIMGPNNPNLLLEDTSDISYTAVGVETTSGRLVWLDGESGSKQFTLRIKPYTNWEVEKVFVIEISNIQANPSSVGNGEVSPTSGQAFITIQKFGHPNGIIEFSGVALSPREFEEPVGEQTVDVVFQVVRQAATGTTGNIQVHWEVQGTSSNVTDVRPVNGILLLEDKMRQGQITLQLLPDDVPELTEELSLLLVSVEGGAEINTQASKSIFRIRYNDYPHGRFGILAENQNVLVDSADLSRRLFLNFTRYDGTFGTTILTYSVTYNEPLSGVVLSPYTGSVTFSSGMGSAQTSVAIQGSGFLQLGSTFTASLRDVQFHGTGMTQPPELKAGETEAIVPVPAEASNSEVSFSSTDGTINDDLGSSTLTIIRKGTYGSLSVLWTTGELKGNLPGVISNGQIIPSTGVVTFAHGIESKNFTVQVNARFGEVETFVVSLLQMPSTSVSGGARLAAQNLKVTLEPSGVVSFSPASLQPRISERDRQVTMTVARLFGAQGRIEVIYGTVDLTAQGNFDYQPASNEILQMDSLQSTANISITVFEDIIPEQSEQFLVKLLRVGKLPTPTQPSSTPRLHTNYTLATVTILESNDAYGVLWLQPSAVTVKEIYTTVTLKVKRTGGLFGRVSATIRTVGGGESWSSDIVINTGNTTADTIALALGQRNSTSIATGGQDYQILDMTITLQANESEKIVTVVILDDELPEPSEIVLVYLTNVTGGARVARGTLDGGILGYAAITIEPSDMSNGLIGFAENSKAVEADEDKNLFVHLILTRLNAFFGDVLVFWRAKLSNASSEAEDLFLSTQLMSVMGNTTCPAGQSQCALDIVLINDTKPEESFTFIITLMSVGSDAKLNDASRVAYISVLSSDYVRGLFQFTSASRVKVVSEKDLTVQIGIERTQGLDYYVTVGYRTMQMDLDTLVDGVTVYPALDGEDFAKQQGTLVFRPDSEEVQYVDVKLTPALASNNPLPKQFYIILFNPTNGSSISPDHYRARILIVLDDEVATWTAISTQQQLPFNNTNILITLGRLDTAAQGDLSEKELTVIDGMLKKINDEGSQRQLPEEVQQALLNLFCKMLDPSKEDATKGRHQLSQTLEGFAYTMLTQQDCPTSVNTGLLTRQCTYVKISAGRWLVKDIESFQYAAQHQDTFQVPGSLIVSTQSDGINDQCADFHLIEYSSDQWFPTKNGEELLSNRVVSFGFKGRASVATAQPAKFRIHTPDRRIAAKQSKCVYFDTSLIEWVSPPDTCKVENNLNMGVDDFVDCACSHLTNYAVIAKGYDPGIIGYVVWFFISCFISMSCIILVIIAHHLCYQQPTISASLLQHMLFALFATQLCLVVNAYLSPGEILAPNTSVNNYRCIVMGVFWHYFLLAQFFWIMAQAINYWKVLVMNDEHTDQMYIAFFALGWVLPMVTVAVFYAVTYNVYKYQTTLPVDFIYGDVNNNGEICFLTNAYTAVGGVIVPILLLLVITAAIFVKAFQVHPQWEAYDDIYVGHYNITEIRLLMLLWSLLTLTWLWGGLHMVYGHLWMLVLFCICNILQGLLVLLLYGILRNPCLRSCGPCKKKFTSDHRDAGSLPPVSNSYNNMIYSGQAYPHDGSVKGSQASLINEAWERGDIPRTCSQMTVRRTMPNQVYINPPIATVTADTISDLDPRDFDDLLLVLKSGHSYTPSELSRSIDDNDSQFSAKFKHYEPKKINIADTHL